ASAPPTTPPPSSGGCPTWPSGTSMSAVPRTGPRVCAARPWPPACPPASSMSRSSGGDLLMKRIVYWLVSTRTLLVLLFGDRPPASRPHRVVHRVVGTHRHRQGGPDPVGPGPGPGDGRGRQGHRRLGA